MPSGQLVTAGETVSVQAADERWFRLIEHAAGLELGPGTGQASVLVEVTSDRTPLPTRGLRPISRGVFSDGRETVLENAGGSGFDLLVRPSEDTLSISARYRPGAPLRAANLLLGSRFTLLAGQILLHYPALWRAGWRGRAPLHAALYADTGGAALVAGPAGVGKSTVIAAAAAAGSSVAADNLCVGDGQDCFGVAEPLRLAARPAAGSEHAARSTSHGRVASRLPGRVGTLDPQLLMVLERAPRTAVTPIDPAAAARVLVGGTYAAGELRRYWQFAALLALATGTGPAHPPVAAVAQRFAERLRCVRVQVGDGDRFELRQLQEETA